MRRGSYACKMQYLRQYLRYCLRTSRLTPITDYEHMRDFKSTLFFTYIYKSIRYSDYVS